MVGIPKFCPKIIGPLHKQAKYDSIHTPIKKSFSVKKS
jgi:hypothetical protein